MFLVSLHIVRDCKIPEEWEETVLEIVEIEVGCEYKVLLEPLYPTFNFNEAIEFIKKKISAE